MTFLKKLWIALSMTMIGASAQAGVIVLEGSDILGVHQGQAGATQYGGYLFGHFMQSGDDLLVLGNTTSVAVSALPYNVTYVSTLSGVTLSDYDTLYVMSPGGCCSDPGGFVSGFEAAVSAFTAGSGNLVIQDYLGGSEWTSILGFDGSSNALWGPHTDDLTITAAGIDWGFSPFPAFGQAAHQSYTTPFFEGFGYVSLIDNFAGDSILLAFETDEVPGPAPLSLIILGLAGLFVRRRTKA